MRNKTPYRVLRSLAAWDPLLVGVWLGCFAAVFAQGESLPHPVPANVLAADGSPAELWFIQLAGPPAADGTPVAKVRAEQRSFRSRAASARLKFQERLAFDTLWNGVSVEVNPSELNRLRRLPGVKALYPVEVILRPETEEAMSPAMSTALHMTGADIVQSTLGYDGEGIRVGVIDTGIDIDHPDFGGSGVNRGTSFPTARVIKGYDFVGDTYNAVPNLALGESSVPNPDPIPDDCHGHGTHVAGIIGANGEVTGVAPEVLFGAYRVFGCNGSTTSDIILAALERALADKMQVVNISIAQAFQWPQSPASQAASKLVLNGVNVVCAAGNSAGNGLYSVVGPGVGENCVSVASAMNDTFWVDWSFTVPDGSGGTKVIPYLNAWGSAVAPVGASRSLRKAVPFDACSPVESLVGQIALIQYTENCWQYTKLNVYTQARHAQDKGAVGVVLINNQPGIQQPIVAGDKPITIPVVMITQADGDYLSARLASGAVTMTWSREWGALPASTGGLVAASSSYGLTPDLSLKPDMTAPGGGIFSTYPIERGGYYSMSGTSMASPQVAGAVALFLQAFPKTHALYLRHYLQNTANPVVWSGDPASGQLEHVHRQGAGMLNIDRAILATTRIEPGKLSLGEGTRSTPIIRYLKVLNLASSSITYDVSFVNALSTTGVRSPGMATSDANVVFDQPTLVMSAFGKKSLKVTVTPPTGPNDAYTLYGGYILLTPRGGGQVYRVPFAGFLGDYQSIRVLTPTANGYPWLARYVGTPSSLPYVKQAADQAFSMQGNDVPFILAHCEHQSRLLRVEAFSVIGNANLGEVLIGNYVPRNSTELGYFELPWDGNLYPDGSPIPAPDGDYYLKLSVLKALGDASNPAHWETWTSPSFTIARQ